MEPRAVRIATSNVDKRHYACGVDYTIDIIDYGYVVYNIYDYTQELISYLYTTIWKAKIPCQQLAAIVWAV